MIDTQVWVDYVVGKAQTFFPGIFGGLSTANHSQSGKPGTKEEPKIEKNALMVRANAEILFEMFTVVYNIERQEINPSEFGALANSLNEGASLEGIYHGLVDGPKYRALEGQSTAATPAVIKAFSLELANIQVDMKHPRSFKGEQAKAIPGIEYPDGSSAPVQPSDDSVPDPSAPPVDLVTKATQFAQTFVGASVFTLKRILGEEALNRIDEAAASHDQVAQWYVRLVERMAPVGVDYGLKERNDPSPDFHLRWAMAASDDRIKWEVLNRYHRYLNALSAK